ncbi:MAG TPA: hypothetical protein VME46_07400 [Acidimicrobiales bacterium]|nr:hypothetical protein [Acidimicrobiales bacterium]
MKDEVGEGRLTVGLAHDADQERATALLEGRPWVANVESGNPLVLHVRDAPYADGQLPMLLVQEVGR